MKRPRRWHRDGGRLSMADSIEDDDSPKSSLGKGSPSKKVCIGGWMLNIHGHL
jgi:hypothetical protein